METIQQFLQLTPTYVYIILAYLIYVGFKFMKPQRINQTKLLLLPTIMLFLSIIDLVVIVNHQTYLLGWIGGTLIGIVLGYSQYYYSKIERHSRDKQITIPGSLTTFVLLILTFLLKYAVAYTMFIERLRSDNYTVTLALLSGLCAAIFWGRALYLFHRLFLTANSAPLPRKKP